MSTHNVSAIKHCVMDLISAAQENNGYLEVDVKSYLCFVADARAARIDYFLSHVDTKKRLLALKQSTDFNVQRGGTFTEERSTDLNASHGYAFTEEQSTDLNAPQRGAFTEEQSTDLYDPAVFGKKDTRDKVLEQGLVRTTRGRNGTTLVHIDVAIAHLIHICPEIEQFVIDTFKQFGRVMLAIEEGRTEDAVRGLDAKTNEVVSKQLKSEGKESTEEHLAARRSGILARGKLTFCINKLVGEELTPKELQRLYGIITNMVYLAVFGVRAKEIEAGLQCTSVRDACLIKAIRALEYAEGEMVAYFRNSPNPTLEGLQELMDHMQPMLRGMATNIGRDTRVMENTNGPNVKTRQIGTFEAHLPSLNTRLQFNQKLLTSV